MSYGALGGIKVIDFSHARAGPQCTMLLGDMGAEVIKVEKLVGDGSRQWGPRYKGESIDYLSLNRNKEGLAVDLNDPEQLDRVKELVADADVLVQNFRPNVMKKFGLDADTLLELHPKLVYCTISGYGNKGPLSQKRCYDQVIQGFSGFMSVTGTDELEPVRAGIPIADLLGGVFSALGICAALREREVSGRGQHVETSLLQGLVSLMSFHAQDYLLTGRVPGVAGNHHPIIAPTGTFRAADGSLTVAVANDEMWQRMCAAMDRPELAVDPRFVSNQDRLAHRTELISAIESALATRTKAEWVETFTASGVPSGPVHTIGEALEHEQTRANDLVVSAEHVTVGPIEMIGFPLQLSRTPLAVRLPPPYLGQHNKEYGLEAAIGEAGSVD
ncbi:CaiB/BaiF CoA transferase family protein [Mycolicibacterium sp. XJ870]